MWQETQYKLLKKEIEVLLRPLSGEVDLLSLIKQPLLETKRGLSSESIQGHPWVLLPLIVCESISGYYKHTLPAAAALQLLTTAGDVFDDIEDSDNSQSIPGRYGSAIGTNIASILLILAEKAISRLQKYHVEDDVIVRVLDVINKYYVTACIGQHLDLSLISDENLTEEKYLKVVKMKSASQIGCACNIGALLAKADQKLTKVFDEFGQNLGMVAQIANDIRGISTGKDIQKKKITLPIIYALTQLEGEICTRLRNMIFKPEYSFDREHVKDILFQSGAIHYSTIKMELYKQKALDLLTEVEKIPVSVKRLKLFLE